MVGCGHRAPDTLSVVVGCAEKSATPSGARRQGYCRTNDAEKSKAISDGETGGRPELDSYGGDDGRRAAIDYGGDGGHPGVAGPGLGEKQNSFPGEGTVNSVRAMFSPRFAQSMDAKLRASSGADSSRRSGN